jgi:hypothetical protein
MDAARAWQQRESSGFFFGLPQWTAAVAAATLRAQ